MSRRKCGKTPVKLYHRKPLFAGLVNIVMYEGHVWTTSLGLSKAVGMYISLAKTCEWPTLLAFYYACHAQDQPDTRGLAWK